MEASSRPGTRGTKTAPGLVDLRLDHPGRRSCGTGGGVAGGEGDGEGFGFPGPSIVLPPLITGFEFPPTRWGFAGFNPLFGFGLAILRSLLMAGLAVPIVIFWPERTARVARTVTSQPVASGGLGLLA